MVHPFSVKPTVAFSGLCSPLMSANAFVAHHLFFLSPTLPSVLFLYQCIFFRVLLIIYASSLKIGTLKTEKTLVDFFCRKAKKLCISSC